MEQEMDNVFNKLNKTLKSSMLKNDLDNSQQTSIPIDSSKKVDETTLKDLEYSKDYRVPKTQRSPGRKQFFRVQNKIWPSWDLLVSQYY